MKRHHDHSKSYKEKHLVGAGLQIQRYHGGKHGSMQVDTVLERELRVLHLDRQAAGKENDNGPGLSI